jgi:hypothetical protein
MDGIVFLSDGMCRILCIEDREKSMERALENDYSMYRSKYHTRRELNGIPIPSSIAVPYQECFLS